MAPSVINLEVTNDHSVPVEPSLGGSVTVLNVSGDTLYYADNSQVSASNNQGSLTAGQSATFAPPQWLRSAGLSTVTVTVLDPVAPSAGGGASFPTWIDICNPPAGSGIPTTAQGGDPTASLQAAINYANTNNIDLDIYWTKPLGTIAGAAVSGSGTIGGKAYSYSGQILFPARALSAGTITIRIMGLSPVPNFYYGPYPQPAGGAELISSLTTVAANVFDAIPATYPGFGNNAFTAIHVVFEHVDVRCPADPQCNGIDGNNLLDLWIAGSSRVSTTATSTIGTNTGTGFAIRFPPFANGGVCRQTGSLEVCGWPTGLIHDEHFTSELIMYEGCKVGVTPYSAFSPNSGGTGHGTVYQRAIFQGCQVHIQPTGTNPIQVRGLIDIGDVQPNRINAVVNDPNNVLFGEVVVQQWGVAGSPGFPVYGGANLRFVPANGGQLSAWPHDSFARCVNTNGTNYLGVTADTHHPWAVQWDNSIKATALQSNWNNAGGVLKSSGTITYPMAFIRYRPGRSGCSRVVRHIVALSGASYAVYLPLGFVISGTNANNFMYVALYSGVVNGSANTVSLSKQIAGTGTVLAQSAATAIATANTYTVDTYISNPPGGPSTVRVRFGTGDARAALVTFADALTVMEQGGGSLAGGVYTMGATEAGQLVDENMTDVQDGIGFFTDTSSSLAYIGVGPA